jgi:hypothetical protein
MRGKSVIFRLQSQKKYTCFVISNIQPIMKLMMYLENDLIEAVPINVQDLRVPGYLGKFKRTLKIKYKELLAMAPNPPEFLVIDPSVPQQTAQVRN